MRKEFLISLLFSRVLSAQTVTLADKTTKEVFNYKQVDKYYDGTPITDAKVDNLMYVKIDGKFYKKIISSENIPQNFGAKGDASYQSVGDVNRLSKGSDDSIPITNFIKFRKKTAAVGSHLGGSSLYFPASTYKIQNAYIIDDHYTELYGDGAGATVLHALSDGKNANVPIFTFAKNKTSGNSFDSLLSGGGMKDIQLKTDNSAIRNIAVLFDYVEYMKFEDVNFGGFGKSAVKGGFWEGYFKNLKFEGCGTMQQVDGNGNPQNGVIDTDSDSSGKYRDASNNSLFEKITFSSCGGTLLRFTAFKNTTVNLNINGLYAETYHGDLGKVDELPLIYLFRAKGCTINNGFITVNSSGVKHSGTIFKLDDAAELSISNLNISLNPEKTFLNRSVQRLRNFGNIAPSSKLALSSVTFADTTDSVGAQEISTPPFFEGSGTVLFNLLTIQTLSYGSGGTRRLTNIFSRSLYATGELLMQFFDKNGSVKSLQKKLHFDGGKISVYTDTIPNTYETWERGDKILYENFTGNSVGKICVTPGTSGILNNVVGSAVKGTKSITVNSLKNFLVGDWISYGPNKEYNRISSVSGNSLILEQPVLQTLNNSEINFQPPVWKEFGCINQ